LGVQKNPTGEDRTVSPGRTMSKKTRCNTKYHPWEKGLREAEGLISGKSQGPYRGPEGHAPAGRRATKGVTDGGGKMPQKIWGKKGKGSRKQGGQRGFVRGGVWGIRRGKTPSGFTVGTVQRRSGVPGKWSRRIKKWKLKGTHVWPRGEAIFNVRKRMCRFGNQIPKDRILRGGCCFHWG